MNKFYVLPCTKQENEKGYNGPVVSLACSSNNGFVLFFPISEENALIINKVLEKPIKKNMNLGSVIGVYKTMMDSWEAGNRYLSGIYMDTEYDNIEAGEIIIARLIVSDEKGHVDSVVKVNFVHALLLSAIERKEILVTDEILMKLMPQIEDAEGTEEEYLKDLEDLEKSEEIPEQTLKELKNKKKKEQKEEREETSINDKFPVDKEIMDIAKKIMSGKIK